MKHIYRFAAFLIAYAYLMNYSFIINVSAQTPQFVMPAYEDFNSNKTANEIETIVSEKSIIEMNAVHNGIKIDGEMVAEKNTEAVTEMNGYIEALDSNGMNLTRSLINTVTVRVGSINLSEFVNVVIGRNDIKQIKDINLLKIELQNPNEYIMLNRDSIRSIAEKYGEFKIQVRRLSDTYTIRFLDADDSIINKYAADIGIALPARHSEQTVYLFANNNQENWGGQFNAVTGAMEFMTKYSGEYNVSSPEITIKDIDDLSEYEKEAIRFMVVRGYFKLENKKFHPYSDLTRYDFSESLVRMFFALDNDADCSFSDVDESHYRYVAASQKDNIVQGFDDGTFRGENKVTVEQVIALTSRTINNKNGYVYPENLEKYLNFTDDNYIGEWAKKEVSLAIREGIYSKDMQLKFEDNISRKDAAVMLYRLFMIMNNTPKSSEIAEYKIGEQLVHKTIWNKANAIIIVSAAAIIDAIALVLFVLFIVKKRKNGEFDTR